MSKHAYDFAAQIGIARLGPNFRPPAVQVCRETVYGITIYRTIPCSSWAEAEAVRAATTLETDPRGRWVKDERGLGVWTAWEVR